MLWGCPGARVAVFGHEESPRQRGAERCRVVAEPNDSARPGQHALQVCVTQAVLRTRRTLSVQRSRVAETTGCASLRRRLSGWVFRTKLTKLSTPLPIPTLFPSARATPAKRWTGDCQRHPNLRLEWKGRARLSGVTLPGQTESPFCNTPQLGVVAHLCLA